MVGNFEGTLNDPTLTCNVTHEGNQIGTFWSIANLDGLPDTQPLLVADPNGDFFVVSGDLMPNSNFTFLNRVTVLNWTLAIDNVILFCGTGREPDQANVTFRFYSKYII